MCRNSQDNIASRYQMDKMFSRWARKYSEDPQQARLVPWQGCPGVLRDFLLQRALESGSLKWPAGPLSGSQTILHPFPDHTFASTSSTVGRENKEKCRTKPLRDASNGKDTSEKASPWQRLFPCTEHLKTRTNRGKRDL